MRRCFKPSPHQVHPHGAPERNQLIIEVIGRVVQHAGTLGVTDFTVHAVAVANEDVSAWDLFQHVGEVFRPHGGLLVNDVDLTHHLLQNLLGKRRLLGVVDGGGVVAVEVKFSAGIK